MNNTILFPVRETDRLVCVWVPTGTPRTPLACVWIEDKHYPADCIVHASSIEEGREMRLCV